MSAEKTERATPRKLRKARERGDVSQSRDLTTAFVLVTGVALLSISLPAAGLRFCAETRELWRQGAAGDIPIEMLPGVLSRSLEHLLRTLAPFFFALVAAGAALSFLQVGPLLAWKKLAPKLEHLDPLAGLRQKLFSLRAYVEFGKSLLKLSIVGLLCWLVLRRNLETLLGLPGLPPEQVLATSAGVCLELASWALLGFLSLGTVDLLYQRLQYGREQRMSKEDVRREYKDQEGDPQVKARRQQARRELLAQKMIHGLMRDGADAVVVNPTRIACALRYDPGRENVPRLVAKGDGLLAERIREIAREKRIPIQREVRLARILFEQELYREIPADLYEAVGAVFRWVAEQARERGERAPWEERLEEDSEESATDG